MEGYRAKEEAGKKLKDSFAELINSNNRNYLNFCSQLYEARSRELEVDEEVDTMIGQIMESMIYNSLLKNYNHLLENDFDYNSLSNALSSIDHLPGQYLCALLFSLKPQIKDEHFTSELGLLLGYVHEISNAYGRALDMYDAVGLSDKSRELVMRVTKNPNVDFEKEKKDFYPTIHSIELGEKEEERIRRGMGDSEVERIRQERISRANDLRRRLEVFLGEFSNKKEISEEETLESIRQKLTK